MPVSRRFSAHPATPTRWSDVDVRARNVMERMISRCKQFRGLATRYVKVADTYRSLWGIAGTIPWL